MTDEREAAREATRRRAREAYALGQDALETGALEQAARWYERAHRLARGDQTIAFALALLRLRLKDARGAASLLLPLTRTTDSREAWMSLAIARRMQGLPAEAAHVLGEALRRHAVDPADEAAGRIASSIAAESGEAGWCGVTAQGRVIVRTVERGLDLAVTLDGVHCQGGVRTADGLASDIDLPAAWTAGALLEVQARGRGGARVLIGAPIDLRAVLRIDGVVEADGGGLAGWARTPHAPGRRPRLSVRTLAGRMLHALEPSDGAFAVPGDSLPAGMVRVVDERGRDLLGSPLDPGLERRATAALVAIEAGSSSRSQWAAAARFVPVPADHRGDPGPAVRGRRRGIAIVVPAYRGLARTLACLDSLERTIPRGTRIHVIDDASPEPDLVSGLDARAAAARIVLHRHPGGHNRGFPASANLGFLATEGRDVVLLNSDTLVAGDWLARLRAAAYAAPDIGTATPLTNEGSIVGYPKPRHPNDMPDEAGTERLHALAKANNGMTADLPTANGFCMFIRRDCLDAVGLLREDLFAQGYGEENDFCLRARHHGWRHVAALDVYVAHAGGTSFRAGREQLTRRNLGLLNRLHPGYDALIARHIAADPLADARRRLDLARLDEALSTDGETVLIVTHQAGGGVERLIRARRRAIAAEGRRAVVLRGDSEGERTDLCLVEPGAAGDFPNLRFVLPAECRALLALLARLRPDRVEIHHLLGHHASIGEICRDLDVPIDIWVHDYAWFCPRIALLGPARTYCGEPPIDGCQRCVAEAGSHLGDDRPVDALVASSGRLLGEARRIVAASRDSARRMERHFPGIAIEIAEWEPPVERPLRAARRPLSLAQPLVACVVGGIGPEKGIDVLVACVRDAAARELPIRFVVVGHTSEDDRLLAAGPAFVIGPYEEDETTALIRAQRADLAFLPSIWPETWCFALSECWRAGLEVAAFDIGAPAERISQGGGLLLPPGCAPGVINDQLVAYVQQLEQQSDQTPAPVRAPRASRPPSPVEGLVTPPHSARSMPRSTTAARRTRDTAL